MSNNAEDPQPTGTSGLQISDKFRRHFVFPCAGYTDVLEQLWDYTTAKRGRKKHDEHSVVQKDGSGDAWVVQNLRFGTIWTATPTFIDGLHPSQFHVYIPDQSAWPKTCWDSLEAPDSVHIHGSRSQELGISAHLRQGLAHWSAGLGEFKKTYVDLPLGSAIVLRDMDPDPARLKFEIVPNTPDAGMFLTAAELASMWKRGEADMPPAVAYKSLKLIRYLESDVMLVSRTADDGATERFAFKARRKPHTIYHELKVLLQLPSLGTILPPPRYLVTFESGSDQPLVCGFLTTFIEGGSLNARLPEMRRQGLLTRERQLGLLTDITSTLIEISDSSAGFCSNLRPEHIVLSKDASGRERAVFLNFKQTRNLYNWTAPEMYYMEWIAELGSPLYFRSDDLPDDVTKKYSLLLDRILDARGQKLVAQPWRYDNPALGWYWPWLTSTPVEQESAMVYMLGKVLWCVFEGRGDADIVLGRSSPEEAEQRFPDFVRTPPHMRQLIERCTAGAREWIDGPIKVYRRDGVVYPLGMTGLHGEREATAKETKEAIRAFWRAEMCKAEEFAEARMRWDAGKAEEGDREKLHYLDRPTLREVLAELESFKAREQGRWMCRSL